MIRIGMVAFHPDPTTFYTALDQASVVGDEVIIIYGRFKDFNMAYNECPKIPERDNIKLLRVDHKNTQEQQRDIYLGGLRSDDIIFIWDSDMVLMNEPKSVRRFLQSLTSNWDSMQMEWLKKDGSYEQSNIHIFRYRTGWKNKHAGMLADTKGKEITGPNYNVIRSGSEIVFFHLRDQGQSYRANQRIYWDRIHEK